VCHSQSVQGASIEKALIAHSIVPFSGQDWVSIHHRNNPVDDLACHQSGHAAGQQQDEREMEPPFHQNVCPRLKKKLKRWSESTRFCWPMGNLVGFRLYPTSTRMGPIGVL